jgi:hypothetical protein
MIGDGMEQMSLVYTSEGLWMPQERIHSQSGITILGLEGGPSGSRNIESEGQIDA